MRTNAVSALDLNDALDGLTSRQQVFVELVFSGLTHTEAYKRTCDTSAMTETALWGQAHQMAHNPKVQAKLRQLQDKRDEQSTLASNLSREWIQQRLMRLADKAEKEPVRLGALIALGKVVGIDLFRETTRVERIERTPADIDRELEERLGSLALTIEARANTVAEKPQDRRRKPR